MKSEMLRPRRPSLSGASGGANLDIRPQTDGKQHKLPALLLALLGSFAVLLSLSVLWMFDTWNYINIDELLYHLTASISGTNTDIIKNYFTRCITWSLATLILLCILLRNTKHRQAARRHIVRITLCVSVVAIGISLAHVWNTLNISAYLVTSSVQSVFVDNQYVSPETTMMVFPEKKRNLVYIFLESMETTFADEQSGGARAQNVIPELTQLSLEGENFSGGAGTLNGATSLKGTTWTIGAMFAQTSGLPLLMPLNDYATTKEEEETFFPAAVTLGDVLKSEGYQQALMIGSSADFADRRPYFTEHGDYEIMDLQYFRSTGAIPEDYYTWWGFEDARLFEFAKEKLFDMSASDQPFNLTLLSADTHFEDGYLCPDCPQTFGEDQYSNVMACSSRRVAAFVDWIKAQDFYENTTIVIVGDHPTMDSDYCKDVAGTYQRRVYTTYINAAANVKEDVMRQYSTFDLFPTTLASLGVKLSDNRLGLGTNLFSTRKTLVESFSVETIETELAKRSAQMENLSSHRDPVSADVSLSSYAPFTNSFQAKLDHLQTVQTAFTIRCVVWPSADNGELIWYDLKQVEDGSYLSMIPLEDFDNKQGGYTVHFYMMHENGASRFLGSETTYVDNAHLGEHDLHRFT